MHDGGPYTEVLVSLIEMVHGAAYSGLYRPAAGLSILVVFSPGFTVHAYTTASNCRSARCLFTEHGMGTVVMHDTVQNSTLISCCQLQTSEPSCSRSYFGLQEHCK